MNFIRHMSTLTQLSYQIGSKALFFTSLLVLVSCNPPIAYRLYTSEKSQMGQKHMVVSAHPLASQTGQMIMDKGGNAIDAAIATQFTLAVTFPRASSLGGGGFMLFRDSLGQVYTLDFREKAPLLASKNMFITEEGTVDPQLSLYGPLASGVPGTVKAMAEAHRRFGSLKWHELLQPAISIARKGFAITGAMADALNNIQEDIEKFSPKSCPYSRNTPWQKGDILKQPDLSKTLKRIAQNGSSEWHDGKTVQMISAYMEAHGGLIRLEDFQSYKEAWRSPMSCAFNEYTIYSMGPPSSGGVTLCQMLGMIEPFTPLKYNPASAKMVHLYAEVQRRAFADRVTYIGDSDFIKVPLDSLMDDRYLESRMKDYDNDRATKSTDVTGGLTWKEGSETTHLSIVDKYDQAVSMTFTLNSWFGSKVMVPGTGFFLNNEMDDFTAKPGTQNQYGLVGSSVNSIEPEKRMVSSMAPVIIDKNNRLFMVLGTPGGTTIPNSILQVFINVVEYSFSVSQAVNQQRIHHQWFPDKIFIEEGALDKSVIDTLERMGHVIETRGPIGRVEAILIDSDGQLHGAADTRMDDDVEAK